MVAAARNISRRKQTPQCLGWSRYGQELQTSSETIGIRLYAINRLGRRAGIFLKIEAFTPPVSVKDPTGSWVIAASEKSGELKPGPDGHRGDKRKYRDRSCHGLRRQGITRFGGYHGRKPFT